MGAILALLMIVAVILVRVIALDSDPPAFLSWSAGIYTDEGYYTNDARSAVLFHHWAIGDFHSAVLSPLLYLVQLAVFHVVGVGLIQARTISVVFGLLTVLFLWLALRRLYGQRTAWTGAFFLGLSAPFAFYNRLALMETPAVFFPTLAFYLSTPPKKYGVWAGIALGIGAIVKPTALLAAPGMLAGGVRRAGAVLAGLAIAIVLYVAFWYAPHHADLARMNGYYAHQYLPHSVGGLLINLERGVATGARDGILPYLFHFAPALSFLVLAGLAVAWRERLQGDLSLALWLLAPVAAMLFLSYTPSRLSVLFWPALAGLAARGLAALWQSPRRVLRAVAALACAVFLVANGWQFGSAWTERSYTLRDGSRQLAKIAPAGSVVAGQMAPALCLENSLPAVMVQPGLANESQPIERYHAGYLLVTRSPYWNAWWKRAYPPIMRPDHLAATLPVGKYRVDVYRVHDTINPPRPFGPPLPEREGKPQRVRDR